jgi:hypothetical protein
MANEDQKPRRATILEQLAQEHYAVIYEVGDRELNRGAETARKMRRDGKSPREIAKALGLCDAHYVAGLLAARHL